LDAEYLRYFASKSPEEDDDAGRLDKAEEVPRSEFPAEKDANVAIVYEQALDVYLNDASPSPAKKRLTSRIHITTLPIGSGQI
jgi:hypothetical protein